MVSRMYGYAPSRNPVLKLIATMFAKHPGCHSPRHNPSCFKIRKPNWYIRSDFTSLRICHRIRRVSMGFIAPTQDPPTKPDRHISVNKFFFEPGAIFRRRQSRTGSILFPPLQTNAVGVYLYAFVCV